MVSFAPHVNNCYTLTPEIKSLWYKIQRQFTPTSEIDLYLDTIMTTAVWNKGVIYQTFPHCGLYKLILTSQEVDTANGSVCLEWPPMDLCLLQGSNKGSFTGQINVWTTTL